MLWYKETMNTICSSCTKRKYCKSPCEPVERYINQDNNDDTWMNVVFTERIEQIQCKNREGVSITEAILQNYFLDRMKPKEISEKYYKSQQYVYWVIKKYSKIIAENIKKSVKLY